MRTALFHAKLITRPANKWIPPTFKFWISLNSKVRTNDVSAESLCPVVMFFFKNRLKHLKRKPPFPPSPNSQKVRSLQCPPSVHSALKNYLQRFHLVNETSETLTIYERSDLFPVDLLRRACRVRLGSGIFGDDVSQRDGCSNVFRLWDRIGRISCRLRADG